MRIVKLISGGQTGADRVALEAGYLLGLDTGGWAPRGFMTTKGKDPLLGSRFEMKELPLLRQGQREFTLAQYYQERTKRNVNDSDATVVFRLQESRGSDLTIRLCTRNDHRPCLVIRELGPEFLAENIRLLRQFISLHNVKILNVAGHRDDVVDNYSEDIRTVLMRALVI